MMTIGLLDRSPSTPFVASEVEELAANPALEAGASTSLGTNGVFGPVRFVEKPRDLLNFLNIRPTKAAS
jgi:hypothetical protein